MQSNRFLPPFTLLLVLLTAALMTAAPLGAQAPAKKPAAPQPPPFKPKYITVKGELLDMGCYTSRALRGAIHRECAQKCLAMGVPMGIITADSVVYFLTENHDRAMTPSSFPPPNPYLQCKGWSAKQVEISGLAWERKGMKVLEVHAAKVLPDPPPPAKAAP